SGTRSPPRRAARQATPSRQGERSASCHLPHASRSRPVLPVPGWEDVAGSASSANHACAAPIPTRLRPWPIGHCAVPEVSLELSQLETLGKPDTQRRHEEVHPHDEPAVRALPCRWLAGMCAECWTRELDTAYTIPGLSGQHSAGTYSRPTLALTASVPLSCLVRNLYRYVQR